MSVTLEDLVESGIYPDTDTAVREAVRTLWQERPQIRVNVAVHKYVTEQYSVAAAAALAGVAFDRMKEILAERGVTLRIGPETVDEARSELINLRRMKS
jgi:predicted HTH domain antitoxin